MTDYDDVLGLRPMCDPHSRHVIEHALDTLGHLRGLDEVVEGGVHEVFSKIDDA